MKLAALVLIAAALTGCAASGPKYQSMASTIPAIGADQGRVYFYRNASMVGGAVTADIHLDGSVVGTSKQGGFFYVDAKPGSHEAKTSTEAENKLTFALDKGETKYVRTKVQMGLLVGRIVPELVNEAEAKKELGELSFTGK